MLPCGPGCSACPWAAARPRDRHTRASLGASARSPARPRHRPRAPQPGPPVPPVPSTPVGPCVLTRIHLIAEPTPNFACNSPTTLSNPEIRSLELQRFYALLNLHPIELHATFLRQSQPPPTGTAAWPSSPSGTLHAGGGGGFCSIRSWLPACRRRVVVLMTPFPPFGGGEAAA